MSEQLGELLLRLIEQQRLLTESNHALAQSVAQLAIAVADTMDPEDQPSGDGYL